MGINRKNTDELLVTVKFSSPGSDLPPEAKKDTKLTPGYLGIVRAAFDVVHDPIDDKDFDVASKFKKLKYNGEFYE